MIEMSTVNPFPDGVQCASALLHRTLLVDVISACVLIGLIVIRLVVRWRLDEARRKRRIGAALLIVFIIYGMAYIILFFPVCVS